jgi:hypothetical protein
MCRCGGGMEIKKMKKVTTFVIDDVIWLFRDLTRQRPVSMFDNPFLACLKRAHDKFGLKIQLNIFFRTDPYYGNDEFSLSEMTDAYKSEWAAASDWLKFGFHSKQEFPDYPYINADYDQVYDDFMHIRNEVYRFATPDNWSIAVLNHWRPMSKDGCRALYDCGVRLISATIGDRFDYDGDPLSLPYGHANRLLHNRKPETKIFIRDTKDKTIARSLTGYNHITQEELDATHRTVKYVPDKETGLVFKNFTTGLVHNLSTLDEIEDEMKSHVGYEFVGWGTHEQYFHKDYLAYQPDYEEKLMIATKVLYDNGYEFIFMQDLI